MSGTSPSDKLQRLLESMTPLATTPEAAARVLDSVLDVIVKRQHNGLFWGDRMLTLDKAMAFRSDPAFRLALTQADSSTGQNQYASPDGISWRYHTLIWAVRTGLRVAGDLVECGVFRGDMSWMVTETVDLRASGKAFYLYDTFAGFDPRYSSAADTPEATGFFDMADREYKQPGIEDAVRRRFADKPYVHVIKGSVPDVLRDSAPERVAFLHLDMNSPAPEIGALEVLFERISTGGIIVFDDYGWSLMHRQRTAADEFMAARGQAILELPTGQGLVVKQEGR